MIFSIITNPKQYRLHGYVCGPGCFQTSDLISTVTFEWIYLNRPMACRYAIAGDWNTKVHGEEVVVWDMFDVTYTKRAGRLTLKPPNPKFQVDDLDAAVMATSLLYDNED